MKKQKRPALNLSKGFTIIELIVVIAIIAVLAAIVLVNVTQYIGKARDAAVMADLKQLSAPAAIYYAEKGTYAGFCQDTEAQKIGRAIHAINPDYKYNCQDGDNSTVTIGYNHPNSWVVYAEGGALNCQADAFVAWVEKVSAGKYVCWGEKHNSNVSIKPYYNNSVKIVLSSARIILADSGSNDWGCNGNSCEEGYGSNDYTCGGGCGGGGEAYCGDGSCNNGENCSNCSSDCGCSNGQTCQSGSCANSNNGSEEPGNFFSTGNLPTIDCACPQ